MKQQFVKTQLKLMKYSALIGIIGGIASFTGPNYHGLIKAMFGVVIGCALLGKRLLTALKWAFDSNREMMDEMEDSFKN